MAASLGAIIPAILPLATPSAVRADSAVIRQLALKNGITIKVIDVPQTDRVCVLTLFRVGAKYDPVGSTGMAHFVEHMLTTGEAGRFKTRTADQFLNDYTDGSVAQTFDDCTIIAAVVKRDRLDEEIERASERMRSLKFDKEIVERERKRVTDEVEDSLDRNPDFAIYYLSRRATYSGGYFSRQRVGIPAEVEKIRRSDLENYYNRFYRGANAHVVLVGNLSRISLESLAERYFRRIQPGEKPVLLEGAGQRTLQSEFITEQFSGLKSPVVTVAYYPPALVDRDHAAFMLLFGALQMRVQEEIGAPQSAIPAVDFNPYTDSSLIRLHVAGRSIGETLGLINRISTDLGNRALSSAEMALARANISIFIEPPPEAQIAAVAARDPGFLYSVAFTLATRDALGIGPILEEYKAALDRVTPVELQRIARAYLSARNRVVIALLPK